MRYIFWRGNFLPRSESETQLLGEREKDAHVSQLKCKTMREQQGMYFA